MRILVVAVLAGSLCCAAVRGSESPGHMLELTLKGQRIEGTPLAWNSQRVYLLGRDGWLRRFRPDEPSNFRQVSSHFQGYSASELRARLLRELGEGYEVTGTGHYMVAHPRGQRDEWAGRFEDLYRSLVHYFSVRGFKLEQPPCLLLGITFGSRPEFVQYTAAKGTAAPPGVLGWYEINSNRILLYKMDRGADSGAGKQTIALVIHEATHQAAFNTGVHSRCSPPPLWLAEGLATMFEAPGVYDPHNNTDLSDRVNRGRFQVFTASVRPQHRPELLMAIVASDDLFRTHPSAAYAEAWALSFYLAENEPRKYASYLKQTAGRSPFAGYSAAERKADFEATFGSDWRMLEARLLRFMAGLR